MLSLARHFFHLFAKTLIEVLHVILMKENQEKWWNNQATYFTAISPVRALKEAINNDLPFN